MLTAFVDMIRPSTSTARLSAVWDLVSLSQGSQQGPSKFIAQYRRFASALGQVTVQDLLPLFALVSMDQDRYDGMVFWYTAGDPTVLGADLALLETLMCDKESRKQGALGVDAASANRAH